MSRSTRLLWQAVLKHNPQRHGLMQPRNAHGKYHEVATPPSIAQIAAHLNGSITLAAPAVHQGRTATIVLDVDADALTRVPLIIDAAQQHQLWAWGEIHETSDRGYVHIPFAQLASAAALKHLGDTLITAAGLHHVAPKDLDNRTMNNAITRLPFGVHTWTDQRGLLVFPDGASYDLNTDLDAGLTAWCDRYTENPLPATISSDPAPLAPAPRQTAPAPRTAHKRPDPDYTYSAEAIQQLYNERYDVCTILANHGAKRGSRNSWHCPCGRHQHGDRHASLQIKAAKNPKYGRFIVQGFSGSCAFFSDRQRTYDAFNVYATLNGLSNADMLQHARADLGLGPDQPARAAATDDQDDHHQRRRAPRPAAPALPGLDIDQTRQHALQAFLSDHQLTKAAMRVYTSLYNHTSSLRCRPSIAAIAADTGMHPRTVQRALRQLEQHGHITTNHTENIHGDQTSIYTLRLPPAFSSSADHAVPPAQPVPLAFSPPDIKACKGGASRPAAPTALSVATEPPVPAPPVASPAAPPVAIQPEGRHTRFPQKVTIQNIRADDCALDRAEDVTNQVLPSMATEPALPAVAQAERTIVARRRVFLRTVDDLATGEIAQAAPPPSAAPAAAASRSVSVQPEPASDEPGATFSPLPEGVYCDPDTGELRPIPLQAAVAVPRTKSHQQLVAEQTASAARQAAKNPAPVQPAPGATAKPSLPIVQPMMALNRPDIDTCPDELAVMRDCVQRLRAAALVEQTSAAWGRYHREHARLAAQERHLAARVRRPEAPPLHALNKKAPLQAAPKKQRRMVQQSLGSMP